MPRSLLNTTSSSSSNDVSLLWLSTYYVPRALLKSSTFISSFNTTLFEVDAIIVLILQMRN